MWQGPSGEPRSTWTLISSPNRREKNLAVVRAHKAGIPASKLGSELGIKPINIYLWTREVKKRGEAKAFQRDAGSLTAVQAKLLKAAKSVK